MPAKLGEPFRSPLGNQHVSVFGQLPNQRCICTGNAPFAFVEKHIECLFS